MNRRLKAHLDYLNGWKEGGKRTRTLVTPCCHKDLEVPAPPEDDGQRWDSVMVCPHCGEMFVKVVTFGYAEGLLPPEWAQPKGRK
jgi:hypothetical protein